mgnify:CR=1 FL=1
MKNKIKENYLERKPLRAPQFNWSKDEQGIVTLEIENTGFFNKMAQKFFKKPKISYVHLDEMGSFVWPSVDGEKDLIKIAKEIGFDYDEEAKAKVSAMVDEICDLSRVINK